MNAVNLTRRDFLRVSATGTSGFLLSIALPGGMAEAVAATSFEPNAWLRIDADGIITVTVAKQEMGQGVLTSLAMIVAEELDADWPSVRSVQADAHPNKYGSQGTGGSSSVRTSYERLRVAGATAREMLVAAAANKWGVPSADCRTDRGFVLHTPSGRRASYGSFASSAATQTVPEKPKLKDPKDFRIIGTRTKRLDTSMKTNGAAVYGIDTRIPGMVFATIARCPVFGGKVKSFNATKARSVEGVLDVVQTEDGVVVVGRHSWAAIRGRDLLDVEWDEGQWAEQSSDAIWKQFSDLASTPGTADRTAGDPASALSRATKIVEAVYRAPLVAHAAMEPLNCTVALREGGCEIWVPTQSPQRCQSDAAKTLGVPIDNVTLHVTHIGGGFGRRLNSDYVVEAVRAAQAIRKPVQVLWTREDDMTHDFYRPCTYNVMKAGLDANGSPIAWTHRTVGPTSKGLVVSAAYPEYEIPNVTVDYHIVDTGVPIGAWRSVGPSQNIWMVESFIDELAAAAGKDPVRYRLDLLANHPRHMGALKEAAEKSGWGTSTPANRARGVAVAEDFGTVVAEVAEVSVEAGRVKVHRIVAVVDCGQYVNPDTIEAQVQGAIVYGLSAALYGEITVVRGQVQQQNFDSYPVMRIDDMPKVEVHIVKSDAPMGGIGEPGLPPAAAAVCNALFALTGKRVRQLPVNLR